MSANILTMDEAQAERVRDALTRATKPATIDDLAAIAARVVGADHASFAAVASEYIKMFPQHVFDEES